MDHDRRWAAAIRKLNGTNIMDNQNDEFLKRLLVTFRDEAEEHLQAISAGLMELEKNPAAERYAEIIETVFREAHSLKGAARSVSLKEIESVCHPMESLFAALKGKRLAVSEPLFNVLYQALDTIGGLLSPDTAGTQTLAPVIRRLDDALSGRLTRPSGPPPVATPAVAAPGLASETIRVSTRKLDAVMRQVEELLSPRLASMQRASELCEIAVSFAPWKKQRARMRPVLRLIERYADKAGKNNGTFPRSELPKLLAYLESEHQFMKMLEQRLLRLGKTAAQDSRNLTGMSGSLLHDVKQMQLMPFSSLLEIFPRVTREIARDQGKQVELTIQGGDLEIDRHTLEEMKDPLMHLLRNSIDHGIELPAERLNRGKPEQGSITVSIAQRDGGKIEILVADDGAGIVADKVKAAASRLGLVSDGQLSEQEVRAMIFQSGFSTSQIITDISGRGLGLAIVQEKVERLGGIVAVESRPGAGATFCITLPLMLATFRGVLVRVGEHRFVIPALSVERVIRVAQQDIRTVENRATIPLGGQAVALVSLSDVLELPGTGMAERVMVIVLNAGHRRVAFHVDEILGEQEVLVKTLGRQLARVRNVTGASVLGNGQVVAVLNVPDLLKSAVKPAAPQSLAAKAHVVTEKQSILVVEDSITSRMLLKNILESAGYRVATAVDGVEGYTTLKTEKFDLIVSDVEMPRMDGMELTARVRADKQLCDLPVVLVTSLGSSAHRERGIEVGANAYIVKSDFDQSNLLEVIRRLI